ncbi:MAG: type II secretion system F family protein [Brevinematia bacterium]
MIFRYKCLSEDGDKIEGIIEAASKENAVLELNKMFPIILEVKEEKGGRKKIKVDRKDIITFTDLLSIAVNAGLPIVKSLELAGGNITNRKFKEIINIVISGVKGGMYLSDALSMHSDVFDNLYISIVKSGESSGRLGESLKNLSNYLERSFNLSSKIKSAMTYPIIVLVVAIGVVFLFLTSIVPKFSEIYSSYGSNLPAITKITVDVGNFVKDNVFVVLLSVLLPIWFIRYLYNNFEVIKDFFQKLMLKFIPPLGNFLIISDVEKFSRVMSIMLDNGVMILDALENAKGVLNIVNFRKIIEVAISEVERGRFLSEVLSEYPEVPNLLVQMVKVGEETGELSETFRKVADFYSFTIERQSEVLVSSISPVMIAFVGIIVGFLVLSLFLPMFNLQQVLIGR